ncbi:hypothetical protein BH20ACI3_BH20ACI3_25310 [soil metagenome]
MRARKYSSVCTLDGVAYVSIGIDISGSCSLGWDLALLCGDFMQTISQLLRLYADFYCNKKRRRSFVTSPVQAGQCGVLTGRLFRVTVIWRLPIGYLPSTRTFDQRCADSEVRDRM